MPASSTKAKDSSGSTLKVPKNAPLANKIAWYILLLCLGMFAFCALFLGLMLALEFLCLAFCAL